jgi:large subunit ribosomal protein L24
VQRELFRKNGEIKLTSKTKTKSPSKQRARIYKANIFEKHKLMSARLSKDLRNKYNVKKMPIRKGDIVYVTSGDFVGTEGKIIDTYHKKQRLSIDGIAREKADKSKITYPIHISKVIIRRFGKVDKSRKKILERRAKKTIELLEEDISEEEILSFEEE